MIDDYEVARQSPLQFWSKADRARYVAYCLWTLRHGTPPDPAPIGGESDSAKFALLEGWLRESSVALELIIKAVFAQRQAGSSAPMGVPGTHDVPKLWRMAGLPKVSAAQDYRLHVAFQILQWSGRYPSPLKGRPDLFEELDRFRTRETIGRASHLKAIAVDWDGFDDLYQIAFDAYLSLDE